MRRGWLVALLLSVLAACGGGGGSSGGSGSGTSSSSSGSSTSSSGSSGGSTSSGSSGGSACAGTFLNHSKLLVGAQMEDVSANAAPFDARYLYISGGIRPAGTCATSCSDACKVWWGCWQEYTAAPGLYATRHIQRSLGATWQGSVRPQIPMFTYYEILQSTGVHDGTEEVGAINDAAFLTRYFDDWRFLLQKIGSTQAMLHVEPDFWGYVRQVNSNPHAIPAPVAAANPTDCGAQENSVAGFARCMIAMVRKYAPNAAVGLHASNWLAPYVDKDGQVLGNFMLALGAGDSDFVATDPSDRDAGFYQAHGSNTWWTDTDAANYLAWSKLLADTVGKPTVMWQIPLGNMSQNNTTNHWQDNRVDWLFAHLADVAGSGIAALLFGAGEGQQTTPESDGGNLVAKTTANWQAGGTALCH
jgi:hypothetical protein